MSDRREKEYRRLLRWYSRGWRERHGEVLMGILLDDAEARGRVAPTVAERLSAARDGIASRLTVGLALGAALAGLAIAATGGIAMIWIPALGAIGYAQSIASALAVLALVALARERSLLSDRRALAVIALSPPTFVCGALALSGWGAAFTAADDGVTATGLGAAWPWLLISGWVLGSAVCVLLIDALFRRTRLHRAAVAPVSILLGVVLATSIAPLLITPLVPAIASAVAAGIALALVRPSGENSLPSATPRLGSEQRAGMLVRRRITPGIRRGARVLALVSGFGSTIGLIYAFTGASWWSAAPDATIAMGQGISIALLSSVPFLAAVGMLGATRSRRDPQHTWGPLALVALSFAAVAVGYLTGPDWNRSAPGFAAGAAFTGAALAWWMTPRIRGSRALRIALSALTGLAYAGFFGLIVLPLLAFALPIGAFAIAAWPRRRPPRDSVESSLDGDRENGARSVEAPILSA